MPGGSGRTGDIQAVHRVVQILQLFTVNRPRVTVAEAAAQLGLNRTTVHRYFGSLLTEGVLERSRDEPTAFVPGRLLLELGAVAHGQRNVLDIAPRYMRELSLDTRCTVVLSLWGKAGAVVSLVEEVGTFPILVTVRIGTALGLDAAQTRLFAALLKDQQMVKGYLAGCSAADRAAFERQLPALRRRGTCRHTTQELDAIVLAAAVFDDYDVAATIALVGTSAQLPEGAREKEDALVRTALRITDDLGGRETRRVVLGEPPDGRD